MHVGSVHMACHDTQTWVACIYAGAFAVSSYRAVGVRGCSLLELGMRSEAGAVHFAPRLQTGGLAVPPRPSTEHGTPGPGAGARRAPVPCHPWCWQGEES